MVDYIVVGLGLAGISFCETLEAHNKSFAVFTDNSQQASLVAGGLYNPVVLKRFTLAWKGQEQLEIAHPFYTRLEQKLGVQLNYALPVCRRFATAEEQNAWFEAADRPGLNAFLCPSLVANTNPSLYAPFGFGVVKHTGRIDTRTLIAAYKSYLTRKGCLTPASFDFSQLHFEGDYLHYQSLKAKHLVFACGYGLKNNPFFNYLPLKGTKGELLTIKTPDFEENRVIKAAVFSIPIAAQEYCIGATYTWKDKTQTPTETAKKELLEKLSRFFTGDFQVTAHRAGIRPTVADRRPLAGQHPRYKNLYVLNGLGSRGVLIAPYVSKQLFNGIEKGTALDPEIDIRRFTKKYYPC